MGVIRESIVSQGHGSLSPSYFCVHSTANPGATAANHVAYWRRNPSISMTHLVSDWTAAYHTVPYDRLCHQVGNGNGYVEGLEICEATNADDFMRGIEIAAQVVRERLAARGWGVGRLITHDMARRMWGGTDHTDPNEYFARWGYSWDRFIQLVENGDDMISNEQIQQIANATREAITQYNWEDTAVGGNCYNAWQTAADRSEKIWNMMQKNERGFSGVGDLVACHPYGDGTPESEDALWVRVQQYGDRLEALESKMDRILALLEAKAV